MYCTVCEELVWGLPAGMKTLLAVLRVQKHSINKIPVSPEASRVPHCFVLICDLLACLHMIHWFLLIESAILSIIGKPQWKMSWLFFFPVNHSQLQCHLSLVILIHAQKKHSFFFYFFTLHPSTGTVGPRGQLQLVILLTDSWAHAWGQGFQLSLSIWWMGFFYPLGVFQVIKINMKKVRLSFKPSKWSWTFRGLFSSGCFLEEYSVCLTVVMRNQQQTWASLITNANQPPPEIWVED